MTWTNAREIVGCVVLLGFIVTSCDCQAVPDYQTSLDKVI